MSINATRQKQVAVTHPNFMNGASYDVNNPLTRLRITASSCFFGEPQYYVSAEPTKKSKGKSSAFNLPAHWDYLLGVLDGFDSREWSGKTPAAIMEQAIDNALAFDAEKTLIEAVRLRNEENMRSTPQVIMVRAAHHPKVRGTGLIAKYAAQIILRADEPCTQLAYCLSKFGRAKIPNALKSAWRTILMTFTEYELSKYRMDNREVKLVDVVRLTHATSTAIDKLCRNELSNEDQTWEAIISKEGSTSEAWEKSVKVMGHMALLRNLRNLAENKVKPSIYLDRLLAGAEKGRQLPFRYYSAYKALASAGVDNAKVIETVEKCLMASLGNLPSFSGRVMSLCDNSGSAQRATTSSLGSVAVNEIANLSAILTAMRSDEGHVGVFGDNLETFSVRKNQSVFDNLDKAKRISEHIGQSTENGIWLFFDKAIKEKEHWDMIFIYSDMQAGHGGLYGTSESSYKDYKWHGSRNIDVAKLIKTYREKVNKNVLIFMVQVAGYNDSLIPEFYRKSYILGGWGDGILRFAADMDALENGTVQKSVHSQEPRKLVRQPKGQRIKEKPQARTTPRAPRPIKKVKTKTKN